MLISIGWFPYHTVALRVYTVHVNITSIGFLRRIAVCSSSVWEKWWFNKWYTMNSDWLVGSAIYADALRFASHTKIDVLFVLFGFVFTFHTSEKKTRVKLKNFCFQVNISFQCAKNEFLIDEKNHTQRINVFLGFL